MDNSPVDNSRPDQTGNPVPADPDIPDRPGARPDDPAQVHTWGPDRRLPYLSLAGMVAAIVWRLLDSDPENRLVAVVLAVLCAIVTVLLVRIRRRLVANDTGIVITGPIHSRRISWADIDLISTPRRGRFGKHAAWLELEVRPADADRPADAAQASAAANAGDVPGSERGPVGNPAASEQPASGEYDAVRAAGAKPHHRPDAESGRADPSAVERPDTELLTFGAFDLGTDPAGVGRVLLRMRRNGR